MRNRFDRQIVELNNNIIEMGTLCENAISNAIMAFLNGNSEHAKKAIEEDKEIDEKEKIIEQQCLRLLLQQQPVAKDLRVISSALKMITDMERIGDQAADIAELTKYTSAMDIPNSEHIKLMARESVKMVNDAVKSFVKQDLELAIAVIAYDDIVDALFCTVKSDIIELLKEGIYNAEVVIDTLMITKYLERIADHATNIAEWVVFSITGNHEEG